MTDTPLLAADTAWQQTQTEQQQPTASSNVHFRRLSEVTMTAISWLWPSYIARGKITMIAGDPGLGKSQLTANLAAVVTKGGRWPVSSAPAAIGNVIFLSAEDDAGDTLRPRLEAAGADTSRVYILDAVRGDSCETRRNFNLRRDLKALEEMLAQIGGAALIIIDPITAYLGDTDEHKNGSVRALLHPLGELAARHNTAVVCISHNNKGGNGQKALMRVSGSVAFVGVARASFTVAKDKGNPERRLLLPTKNNIGNDRTGFSFEIETHVLPSGIETSRIVWGGEVSITADEALDTDGGGVKTGAVDEAERFLTELLSSGAMPAQEVEAEASGAGISKMSLRRARAKLGIKPHKDGFGKAGKWLWELPTPPKMLTGAIDAHADSMNTLGRNEHLSDDAYSETPKENQTPAPEVRLNGEAV